MQAVLHPLEPRRLLATGAIDWTFAGDGVLDPAALPGAEQIVPLHADALDRLYVGVDYPDARPTEIARYTPVGVLDTSWADVGIAVTSSTFLPADFVLAGDDITLVFGDQLNALNLDGSFDTARFDGDGVQPLAPLPDGVIATTAIDGTRAFFESFGQTVTRIDADGNPITAFGANGTLDLATLLPSTVEPPFPGELRVQALEARTDGSLLIAAAYAGRLEFTFGFSFIVAVDANGTPIPTFGDTTPDFDGAPDGFQVLQTTSDLVYDDLGSTGSINALPDGRFASTFRSADDDIGVRVGVRSFDADGQLVDGASFFNPYINADGSVSAVALADDGALYWTGSQQPSQDFSGAPGVFPETYAFLAVTDSDNPTLDFSTDGDGRIMPGANAVPTRFVVGAERVFLLQPELGGIIAVDTAAPARTYVSGTTDLTITGTPGNDFVRDDAAFFGGGSTFSVNGERFALADYPDAQRVTLDLGAGDDDASTVFPDLPHTLLGGDGNDALTNRIGGPAALFGNNGDDTLNTWIADTADVARGGDGIDRLNVGGQDSAFGDAGNDTLVGGFGDNDVGDYLLEGLDGDDLLISEGRTGTNTLRGQAGDDTFLFGNEKEPSRFASDIGTGADDISGGTGTDTVDYLQRSSVTSITTAPDGVESRDDGADGEGDFVRNDVENFLGVDLVDGQTQGIVRDLGNGFAEILGTRLDDDLRVYDTRFDGGVIVLNGIRFDFTQLDRISAALGAGDDFYRNFTDDLAPVGGVIEGNAGNDTLRGSFAAETLSGGEGDDQIISVGLTRATLSVGLALGSSGDDDIVHSGIGTVDAGDGNDSVRLEGTPVTRTVEVFTGAGNDYVTAITPGRLVVRTDAGNDTIDLRTSGQATVFAGTGDDLVTYGRIADAQRGSEQIFLQSGDDKAIALGLSASGQALVTGDQGNDTLVQQDGPDLFYDDTFRGGDGTDWIDYGQRRDETIVWTRDNTANDGDTIRGERDDINDDVEYAFGVDDYTPLPINFLSGKVQQIGRVLYLNGTEFNDSVRVERFVDDPRILEINIGPNGGRFYLPNDDRIDRMEIAVGRGDDDVQLLGDVPTGNVSAGPGDDYVLGGSGNDFIVGGDGRDTLAGATGNDTLRGDAGADRLGGGKKSDLLFGGAGDDRLFGDAGSDTLDGGGNVDRLFGGDGNDDLRGGSSNDKLYGQAGNDTLTGGRGRDLFDGGPGNDTAFLDDEDDPDNVALLTDIENLV